jgi:RNA-directed DNA polymerase
MSDRRQKNQLYLAFPAEDRGEAPRAVGQGTESLVAKRRAESPVIGEQWMEAICERGNCTQALARVKANRGSPGVDGMTVQELPGYLQQQWLTIRNQLRLSSGRRTAL